MYHRVVEKFTKFTLRHQEESYVTPMGRVFLA
jgi:hypothetical protein